VQDSSANAFGIGTENVLKEDGSSKGYMAPYYAPGYEPNKKNPVKGGSGTTKARGRFSLLCSGVYVCFGSACAPWHLRCLCMRDRSVQRASGVMRHADNAPIALEPTSGAWLQVSTKTSKKQKDPKKVDAKKKGKIGLF
jgi:hypothetical protein